MAVNLGEGNPMLKKQVENYYQNRLKWYPNDPYAAYADLMGSDLWKQYKGTVPSQGAGLSEQAPNIKNKITSSLGYTPSGLLTTQPPTEIPPGWPQWEPPDTGEPDVIDWDTGYKQAYARLNPYYSTLRSQTERDYRDRREYAPQLQAAKYGGVSALRGGRMKSQTAQLTQDEAMATEELENSRASAIAALAQDIIDKTNAANYQKWAQQAQLARQNSLDAYNAKLATAQANMARTDKEEQRTWELYLKGLGWDREDAENATEAQNTSYANAFNLFKAMGVVNSQEMANILGLPVGTTTADYELGKASLAARRTGGSGAGGSSSTDIIRYNKSMAESAIWDDLNSGKDIQQVEADIMRDAGKYSQLGINWKDLVNYAWTSKTGAAKPGSQSSVLDAILSRLAS
jgi:hypothetical protein